MSKVQPVQPMTSMLVKPKGMMSYIVATVIMSFLTIVAIITVLYLRPGEDNTILIGVIIGFNTTTTGSLLAFMKSQETHLSVNSRLDAFIEQSGKVQRAEGKVEGRKDAEEREDELKVAEVTATKLEVRNAASGKILEVSEIRTDVLNVEKRK